jgi:hypothetical protein
VEVRRRNKFFYDFWRSSCDSKPREIEKKIEERREKELKNLLMVSNSTKTRNILKL